MTELRDVQLPAFLQSAIARQKFATNAYRVDGQIIGTGEADFTKGNTVYTLNYKEKTFQLVDVPGIEGDESKYGHMVKEAVAKAHLVFYVNGTNKKPEKATAEKIRSYLRRGTQVCPIVNVRGSADAYEFEEDRVSLASHGDPENALKQTVGVLKGVLGQKLLLPGHCVQGLLAFTSLAINTEKRTTSIHSSRNHDLVTQQRNYLKHFGSPKAMFEFSQVRAIAQVLHAKLGTFREDIIESNKIKVRELLVENIDVLQTALKEHQAFMNKVAPEFKKCKEAIHGAVETFERLVTAGRKNLWNEFFNDVTDDSDRIVEAHFGDNAQISEKIEKAFQARQEAISERLQAQPLEHVDTLKQSLSEALTRLMQDLRRVELSQQITFAEGNQQVRYNATGLSMGLGARGWRDVALNVGSYALTGAGVGSAFPVVGTAIGAVVGAVVGALVSVMHWFTSKEKRIRKAQRQIQEKIDDVRSQVMGRVPDEIKSIVSPLRKEIEETALSQIDTLEAELKCPLDIIQKQIAMMTRINSQIGDMPHGTIQTI